MGATAIAGPTAIGYKAYASLCAMGWESAFSGGFSIAKQAAIGPIAFAEQVNNEMAASISNPSTVNQTFAVILGVMALLAIDPDFVVTIAGPHVLSRIWNCPYALCMAE